MNSLSFVAFRQLFAFYFIIDVLIKIFQFFCQSINNVDFFFIFLKVFIKHENRLSSMFCFLSKFRLQLIFSRLSLKKSSSLFLQSTFFFKSNYRYVKKLSKNTRNTINAIIVFNFSSTKNRAQTQIQTRKIKIFSSIDFVEYSLE